MFKATFKFGMQILRPERIIDTTITYREVDTFEKAFAIMHAKHAESLSELVYLDRGIDRAKASFGKGAHYMRPDHMAVKRYVFLKRHGANGNPLILGWFDISTDTVILYTEPTTYRFDPEAEFYSYVSEILLGN